MSGGMDITATSMLNSLERLNVIGNNLANANTTAYKRDIAVSGKFDAQVTSLISILGSPSGNGKQVVKRVPDMSVGSMRLTGEALDVAIEGKGYFQILTGSETLYSRDGAFQRDPAGRLVNSGGLIVAGKSGEIHLGEGDVFIDEQGRIWQSDHLVDQLNVVQFLSPAKLQKRGAGLYASGQDTGIFIQAEAPKIRQGYLETSNVPVMEEMVELMSTLRHFEMSQQVIRGYDEMLGKAIDSLGKF